MIGVPDPVRGEMVCAVVVPRDPADPISLETLADYLRGKELMVQKIPEQLEIVSELPRNATGKVQKHELRQRFAGS